MSVVKPTVRKKPSEKKAAKPPPPSLNVYRRIAAVFVALAAALLAVLLFVSTVRATVRVTPAGKTITASFLAEVTETVAADDQVRGTSAEKTVEAAREFAVTGGETKEVFDKAGGTVVIYNNTGRDQPLVATTRLLSSGGVLFRLDDYVVVPANGSVEVSVHADQPGPTGDIDPDRFTIPGLSFSLQSLIYAESAEAMAGGRRLVAVVTQEELDAAAARLEGELLEAARTELRADNRGFDGEVFSSEVLEKASDTLPGAESDKFVVSMILRVAVVFYDDAELKAMAEAKLYESLERGFEFAGPAEDLTVSIESADASAGTADLLVELTSTATASVTHPALAAENLVGLTEDEIEAKLKAAGVAAEVEVDFFPPWVRRVPSLKDHVYVEIQR